MEEGYCLLHVNSGTYQFLHLLWIRRAHPYCASGYMYVCSFAGTDAMPSCTQHGFERMTFSSRLNG